MQRFTLTRAALAAAFGLSFVVLASQPALAAKSGEALVKSSDCLACHAVLSKEPKKMGPNFGAIAAKYKKATPATVAKLATKIKAGGSGSWGKVPMSPHPQIAEADLKAMVTWILTQK